MTLDIILKLRQGQNLQFEDVNYITNEMFLGNLSDEIIFELLSLLAEKGETDDELFWMLEKMQEFSLKINTTNAIDMCGTGGDALCTFNISTTASFIAAAAGAKIAKHGNRSSSGSGSAEIFEYFGYDLKQEPSRILEILDRHNIAFLFAPKFHPAMKHVATARKKLAKRTIFNLLGPLANPAGVKDQLIGVSSIKFLKRIPILLKRKGAQNIMTVYSDNGMDELSTCATNRVCLLYNDTISTFSVESHDVGLHKSSLQDIQLKSIHDAASVFVQVLNGTANRSMIETAALNAAGGLVVSNMVDNLKEGVQLALETINNGKAFELLKQFVTDTGDIAKLEEIQ